MCNVTTGENIPNLCTHSIWCTTGHLVLNVLHGYEISVRGVNRWDAQLNICV